MLQVLVTCFLEVLSSRAPTRIGGSHSQLRDATYRRPVARGSTGDAEPDLIPCHISCSHCCVVAFPPHVYQVGRTSGGR